MFRLAIIAAMAFLLGIAPMARAAEPGLLPRLGALADQNNPEALYHLGMIYHLGLEGVAPDRRRALEFFRRAAEAGDPLGAYKLGCYYAGQGGDVLASDEALALRYKLIAAEAGYVLAQMEVGEIYSRRGDAAQAARWYDAAARQGNMTALFMALVQVMPDSPHPNRAQAWLYTQVIDRMLLQEPSSDMTADDERAMQQAFTQFRQLVETGLSDADRAEGTRLFSEWHVVRTPLSTRADLGLDAARRLVALSPAG